MFCCINGTFLMFFFFSSRRRHTRFDCDWSSDVCSSDLELRPIKVNAVAIKGFTETEVPALAELARRKPYVVRFIEFMPLDADGSWRNDEIGRASCRERV